MSGQPPCHAALRDRITIGLGLIATQSGDENLPEAKAIA
jgi:hypothetical protein